MAVRDVDDYGVEEDYADEASARSRRAMGSFTRGARAVVKVFWGSAYFFPRHSGVREAGEVRPL